MKATLKILSCVLALALLGCSEKEQVLKVGAKPFSESMILAEMIAQLAEKEGIAVERNIPYGTTDQLLEATKQGVVDIYPEYNGTALIFLGQAPTSDGAASTEKVRDLFAPLGLEIGDGFGFSNDYAIVMTKEKAEELGVTSISDLANLSSGVTFAVDEDFTKRPADGLQQMLRRYGISGSSTLTFPLGSEGKDQIVSALLDGSADVAELFATDGQIAEYNLVALSDDLRFFPVYEATTLTRADALERFAALGGVLKSLSGLVTAADMQAMNKSVDLDAQAPAAVAAAFLTGKGLLEEGGGASTVETLLVAADPSVGGDSLTARALRAVRAGFPGRNLAILNTTDPLQAIASGEARLAMVGTESFYSLSDDGPVAKSGAEGFAVLGYRTAHTFARKVGTTASFLDMKSIATDAPGTGSAIVLEMLLSSLGLTESMEVKQLDNSLSEKLAGLARQEFDGVFVLASQGDRAIKDALSENTTVTLIGISAWAQGGHTARFSFIRPGTIPANTYPSQAFATPSVTTQYVLASPVQVEQAAGEVGPGSAGAGLASVVPVTAGEVSAISETLGMSEVVDPAIPVHAALRPTITVVEKTLPFKSDISIINIFMIVFTIWLLYACTLPSPRTMTLDDH